MHHVTRALVAVVMLLPLLQARPALGLSRSFMCFFDEGSAVVSVRCEQIIVEFVLGEAEMERLNPRNAAIEVLAHTDTRENSKALSDQRASVVARLLVSYGIAPDRIRLYSFGAERPLLPTGPNVREPQNRLVSIVLR